MISVFVEWISPKLLNQPKSKSTKIKIEKYKNNCAFRFNVKNERDLSIQKDPVRFNGI